MKSLVIVLAAVLLAACNSKYVETAPSGREVKADLKEILKQKQMLNTRLGRIDEALFKVKRIVDLAQKSQKNSGYTPVDLVLDVNRELSNALPTTADNQETVISETIVEVRSAGVPAECKNVFIRAETTELEEATEKISGKTSYFVKGCGTEGKFIRFFSASLSEELKLDLKYDLDGFQKISHYLFDSKIKGLPFKCQTNGGLDLKKLECENIPFNVSKTETGNIPRLLYERDADPTFVAVADISENGKIKASLTFSVRKDGSIPDPILNEPKQN